MSSTNVHSNPCIVGGDTSFTGNEKEPVEMRQYNEKGEPSAGKGPSRLEVIEGPKAEIPASNGIAAKDKNRIKAIAQCKEVIDINKVEIKDITIVNVGQIAAFKKAIDERKAKTSKNQEKSRD